MTLVKFDPFRGFEGLNRRMNNFLSDFDKGFSFETGGFTPRVDITEDDNSVLVNVELPGLSKEDVKISVNEDKVLTIQGAKKNEELAEGMRVVKSERGAGEFTRAFVLPENIDDDSIKAKFVNGVLEISLAKKEPEKPKEINVEIS